MILVMLRPTVAPPRDTECVDIPGGPQTETFFAKDLPEAVTASYRAGKEADDWGIIGNSTGGYCALKIGLHHPTGTRRAPGSPRTARRPRTRRRAICSTEAGAARPCRPAVDPGEPAAVRRFVPGDDVPAG